MQLNRKDIRRAIRAKIIELAQALDVDASGIADTDIIPATGYLDSTAILELVAWFEQAYDLPLKQEEINIDNLGTIEVMTDFLLRKKGLK